MSQAEHESISEHVIELHSLFHNQPLPFARVLQEYPNADDRILAIVVAADIEASREWDFPVTYARYRCITDLAQKPLTLAAIASAFTEAEDLIRGLEADEENAGASSGTAMGLTPRLPAKQHSIRSTQPAGAGKRLPRFGAAKSVRVSILLLLAMLIAGGVGWIWGYKAHEREVRAAKFADQMHRHMTKLAPSLDETEGAD